MAILKFLRGNHTSLDTIEKNDGYIYFCIDDATVHVDFMDSEGVVQRKQLNAYDAETVDGYDITAILDTTKTQTEKILNITDGISILDAGSIANN